MFFPLPGAYPTTDQIEGSRVCGVKGVHKFKIILYNVNDIVIPKLLHIWGLTPNPSRNREWNCGSAKRGNTVHDCVTLYSSTDFKISSALQLVCACKDVVECQLVSLFQLHVIVSLILWVYP